jgi:dihydrofolate reductase
MIVLSVAVSLDGYIADEDGGVDWLNPYFSPEMDMSGFMSRVGAVVVGRRTYEEAMAGHRGGGRLVVLTNGSLDGVETFAGNVGELASRLRDEVDGIVWLMGGGEAARSFLEAGALDELDLNVIPQVLGAGRPLFPAGAGKHELELLESRAYSNGCVRLRYRPA